MNYPGDNSQWIKGQVGGALQFGGPDTQQYLIVADYPKPATSFTASLWAWAESRPTWASWVKNWGGTDAGQFHFGLFAGGGQENIFVKQADGKTPNVSEPDSFLLRLAPLPLSAMALKSGSIAMASVASTDYNGTLLCTHEAIGIGAKLSNDGTGPTRALRATGMRWTRSPFDAA
jgi:hypothetical protein